MLNSASSFNAHTKRILVIDGYAFRGLGPLYVIDNIVKAASVRAKRPVRPCDIFDLICGTSSGALIAILLGRLGLDCRTAISEYTKLVHACCGGDEAKLWESILGNQEVGGAKIPSPFDIAVSDLVKRHTGSADSTMRVDDSSGRTTKTAVIVTSEAPLFSNHIHCIRSYAGPETRTNSSHQWLVREAAHAALATSFFGYLPPDNKYSYSDAAFSGFMNPTKLCPKEQNIIWPSERNFLTLSLGTCTGSLVPDAVGTDWPRWAITDAYCAPFVKEVLGKLGSQNTTTDLQRRVSRDVVRRVITAAMEAKGEHLHASDRLAGSPYHRIDPPLGISPVAFADSYYLDRIQTSVDKWVTGDGSAALSDLVNCIVAEAKEANIEILRSLDPPPPPVETVNSGYNPQMDKKRPDSIMEYLRNYHVLFIVDDSGSMANLWSEAREALSGIAQHAMDFNAHTIDLTFLNKDLYIEGIQGKSVIVKMFESFKPSGHTPTGAVLRKYLDQHIAKLNRAIGKPEYTNIKPLDIVVITDGVPDDEPAKDIAKAEEKIKRNKHHPNCIGIQFVQIGRDPEAEVALEALSYGSAKVGMVDIFRYTGSLSPEQLERILLGAIHPSLRTYLN